MTTRSILACLAAIACVACAAPAANAARITMSSDPEVVSWGYGHHTIFARGSDGALWVKSWTNTENRWTAWESLGGWINGNSKPSAISWKPGHIVVFIQGPDNELYERTLLLRNSSVSPELFSNWRWREWVPAHAWNNTPVKFQGSPKATSWGDGQITVHVRGLDNAQYSLSYAFGSWGNWEYRGGCTTDDIEAISWGSGRIDTFTRGCDRRVYGTWFGAPGWSGISRIGTWEINGPPAVTTWGTNSLELFYKGLDGSLGFSRFNPNMCGGGWCGIQNLGGTVSGNTVEAISRYPGHTAVYAQGAGGNAIWDKWWINGGWTSWWQMSDNGQSSTGAVPAVAAWRPNRQDVFWRGDWGDLLHRYWDGSWSGPPYNWDDWPMNYPTDPDHRYGIAMDVDPGGGWDWFTDGDYTPLNSKMERFTISWNALLQWPDGTYVFEERHRVDNLVNRAFERGHQVMLTIKKCPANPWGCPGAPTRAEYQTEVTKIVQRYNPRVSLWGPANEVNAGDAWLGRNPTAMNPRETRTNAQLLRDYYWILAGLVGEEKMVGPDFHDVMPEEEASTVPVQTWVSAYIAAGGGWGKNLLRQANGVPLYPNGVAPLHPYASVEALNDTKIRNFQNALPGGVDIFLTEVGAFLYRERTNGTSISHSWPEQEDRVDWLTGTVMNRFPRIKRVYYYNFRNRNVFDDIKKDNENIFDTGLVEPAGGRRHSWWLYCRRANNRDYC